MSDRPDSASLRPFPCVGSRQLLETRIFTVHEDQVVSPRNGLIHPVTRLETADWVNMIVITADRQIILVRQWRHGIRGLTLEIPGGMIERGEDPAMAAAREVREETGYRGDDPVKLGVVRPNPAFLGNRCFTYLLENCRLDGDQQLDAGEDIEVVVRPLTEIPDLIARGEIANSLVVAAFWWLRYRRPE